MREFRIGPWVGEFGYWILYVIPFINGLRELYPDSHITIAGFQEEEPYLHDVHDTFIGYPWWPSRRGRAICEDVPADIIELHNIFNATHSLFNLSQPEFKAFIQDAPLLIRRRMGPAENIDEKQVVFSTRVEENLQDTSRNWSKSEWCELAKLFYMHGWKVAACGPNINYFPPYVEIYRTCLEIASKSFFGVCDCGGGQHTLNMCGVPTIVHATQEWSHLYDLNHPNHRNFLETLTQFQPVMSMAHYTPIMRFNDAMKFAKSIKGQPRYKHTEIIYERR